MIRILNAAETEAGLPFDRLIPALRQAFTGQTTAPQRHHHALPDAATLLLMPAWQQDWLGVKIVTVHPANAAKGLQAVNACYLLSDAKTGRPTALLDGDVLTARRTAAASALAASFLARPHASRLLLLGAGRVAALLPEAHRTLRPITEVMVWNRGPARRAALVATLQSQGFNAHPVEDLPAAIATADIISAATLSTTPLIPGQFLQPGVHLDLVGAYTPQMREADPTALNRSAIYADTTAALTECGELANLTEQHLAGTLATLCAGAKINRGPEGITLFKSVGTAIEDLAAAILVAEAMPPPPHHRTSVTRSE